MSTDQLALSNTFELETDYDYVIARGALVESDENPLSSGVFERHAEDNKGYQYVEIEEDSFFVAQMGDFDDEFEKWRMAYGVQDIDEDRYMVWIGYRPEDNTDGHDASKPWINIIQKLGGKA